MNFKELMKVSGKKLQKHSPEILTGIGVAGMFTTAVLVSKATIKATKLLEEEKRERTAKYFDDVENNWQDAPMKKSEVVAVCWKPYIVPGLMFVFSTSCIIGAHSINVRRSAALATAYKLAETSFKEYKDKVVEVVGEKKEKAIKRKIAEDRIEKNPPNSQNVIITDKGTTLCCESISGQYFRSDIETIRAAQNTLNQKLLAHDYVTLNELYVELGIETTPTGNKLGWEVSRVNNEVGKDLIQIDWRAILAKDNQPCLYIEYNVEPTYDFNRCSY